MTNFPLVKEVNFNDDQLLAIQNEQGIYAAVRRMCECIGFSQGQIRRQVDNIENDLVLSKGYANLRFPSNGGNQETTCILLNFLPLWLAKISITPTMKRENPKLVEKLIDYQLKAKDVLAQAFLPQYVQPQSISTDIAMQHLNEVTKQLHNNVESMQKEILSLREYAGDNITALGYDVHDLMDQLTDINEKLEKSGIEQNYLKTYFFDKPNTQNYTEVALKRMLLGSQAEKLAQKISMLPTNEYRKWINDRVFDKARQNHRWSGKIRKDSYIKLAASGYNYLLDNCNLNTILDGKYGDIKFAYTLVMLGVKPTEIRDIISKQWN